jgi:hypothetical protein
MNATMTRQDPLIDATALYEELREAVRRFDDSPQGSSDWAPNRAARRDLGTRMGRAFAAELLELAVAGVTMTNEMGTLQPEDIDTEPMREMFRQYGLIR